MTETAQKSKVTDAGAQNALFQMILGGRIAQAVYVAAKLQIADLLADGPRKVEELAEQSGSHAPSLYRLLRALASLGVFAEDADGTFRLTTLAEPLRSGVPGSLRPTALHLGDPYWWQSMGELLYSVQTGQPAPLHLHGVDEWTYLAQHPETAAVFNDAMTANTERQLPAILEAYDFSGIETIVDIGGGQGALLAAILRAYPTMHGVLFDQPEVVAHVGPILEDQGVAGRWRTVGGSFFETLPRGGDAYLLKLILHDWADEPTAEILHNLRQTMTEEARLLLIEHVILPGNDPQPGKLLDLAMLAFNGGRERTATEWEEMLRDADFSLTRIVPTRAGVSIIEARPV